MNEMFYQIVLSLNKILFNNFGLTIIVLGVLSRLIFLPIFSSQLKQQKKWEDLKPKLDDLKERLKNDKQRLAMEQAKLMKEAGVNPAAGCLPMILQIFIINLLYNSFNRFIKEGLDTKFLFWDLGNKDVFTLDIMGKAIALPGILVILSALFQFIQTKMMMSKNKSTAPVVPDPNKKEDFMQSFAKSQQTMIYLFPLMFLFLGTQWPSGLALYWTVATLMAIGQQYIIYKQKEKIVK